MNKQKCNLLAERDSLRNRLNRIPEDIKELELELKELNAEIEAETAKQPTEPKALAALGSMEDRAVGIKVNIDMLAEEIWNVKEELKVIQSDIDRGIVCP